MHVNMACTANISLAQASVDTMTFILISFQHCYNSQILKPHKTMLYSNT